MSSTGNIVAHYFETIVERLQLKGFNELRAEIDSEFSADDQRVERLEAKIRELEGRVKHLEKHLIASAGGPRNLTRLSPLEQAYRNDGYDNWYSSIDVDVCKETKCEKCGTVGTRFIGLHKGDSRIAISHCDNCGEETEF